MRRIGSFVFLPVILAACAASSPPSAPATGTEAPPLKVTDTNSYNPRTINTVPSSTPTLIEAYAAESPHQFGELRMPPGKGPFPVAVLIHGGCWISGFGSTKNMAPLATWLTEHGVATWNVDYRELGSGGGWPMTFDDWTAALAHVSGLAKRYPLDLSRLTLIGHSAGVTPAIWLAMGTSEPDLRQRTLPAVSAVATLDGPERMSDFVGDDADVCGRPVLAELMGGTPEQVPERYRMVDPLANPPHAAHILALVAALPEPSAKVEEGLKAAGAYKRIDIPEPSHFNFLAPGTRDFNLLAPELLAMTGGK